MEYHGIPWSLPAVYRTWGLGSQKEAMAHNFDHCWQRWHKARQRLQVDSCHLRKPAVTMQQITNRLQISVFHYVHPKSMIYTLKTFHTPPCNICSQDAMLCGKICVLSSSYSCQLAHQERTSVCIFGNCKIPSTPSVTGVSNNSRISVSGPKSFSSVTVAEISQD